MKDTLNFFGIVIILMAMSYGLGYRLHKIENKIDNLTEEVQQLKCSVDSLENYLCD